MSDNQLDRGGEMSAPDARLSAAERAALADLEAAAAAADPQLASRLKSGERRPLARLSLPRMAPGLLQAWAAFLRIGWWALPLTLIGLALVVVGMGAGLAVSIIGALATTAGLRALAEVLRRRMDSR